MEQKLSKMLVIFLLNLLKEKKILKTMKIVNKNLVENRLFQMMFNKKINDKK